MIGNGDDVDGLRHLYDEVVWAVSAEAWPNFGNGGHTCFANDNGTDTFLNNSTHVGMGTGAGIGAGISNVLWIDNPDNADYIRINIQGNIYSITTTGAPAGESIVRAGIYGLPIIGDTAYNYSTLMQTHPLESKEYPITMADAWFNDGVCGLSQFVNSFPPYYGNFFGSHFGTSVIPNGWPFNGNTITAEDRFSIQFPIGHMINGGPFSVSGMRKIGLVFKSVNPALSAGAPSAMAITATMYAHFYEYRKRR